MKKKSGFVLVSSNDTSRANGADMAESNISDPDLYKQMVTALNEMPQRDWGAVANKLHRMGIKNKHGKPWAASSARVVFYQLQKRFKSMTPKTGSLPDMTGKIPMIDRKNYAAKVMSQVEAVVKLEGVDPETKLDLLEKVLKG